VPCGVLAWIALPASERGLLTDAPLPLNMMLTAVEVLFIFVEVRLAYGLAKRFRGNLRTEGSTAEALRLSMPPSRS
jgi:hypothetical protein